MMNQDSTGKPIKRGDRVRFRGREYDILNFGKMTNAGREIILHGPVHTSETPTEWSVDLIERRYGK